MLKDERTPLRNVTFTARLLLGGESRPAANNGLSFMWIVAIGTTDASASCDWFRVGAFENRMSVRQTEFSSLIQMALKADFRGSTGVDNGVMRSTRFVMFAGRSVARLATDIGCVGAFRFEAGMGGSLEPAKNICMALRATG
jgi:hypothetical protein